MRIWVIKIGEQTPVKEANATLGRVHFLCEELVLSGHEVTWWTSTFSHQSKSFITKKDLELEVKPGYTIKYLHSPKAYKKNVSIARLVHNYLGAKKLKKELRKHTRPDLILAAYPTIEMSLVATSYGQKHGVPVILDARDMWPDIFVEPLPTAWQPFLKLFLRPYFYMARKAFKSATAIFGITEGFVNWGLRYANRERNTFDAAFPLAFNSTHIDPQKIEAYKEKWTTLLPPNKKVVVYIGAFSRTKMDIPAITHLLEKVSENERLYFLFCGNGDDSELIKEKISHFKNVHFHGWVSEEEGQAIMQLSSIGFAPYISKTDYCNSIPTKVIKYLSLGLPVLTSLKGDVEDLIKTHDCGLYYQEETLDLAKNELFSLTEDTDAGSARLSQTKQNALTVYHEFFDAKKVYQKMVVKIEEIQKSN